MIIDKLKSIETKLDELKTLDSSGTCPYGPDSSLFLLPEVGATPSNLDEKNSLATEPEIENVNKAEQSNNNNNNEDDDTLKEDLEKCDVNSQTTDISHTTELFVDDENIVVSSPVATPNILDADVDKLLSKTSVAGSLLNKNKTVSGLQSTSANVDIMSIHTMSPEVDDADDEDEEGMEF